MDKLLYRNKSLERISAAVQDVDLYIQAGAIRIDLRFVDALEATKIVSLHLSVNNPSLRNIIQEIRKRIEGDTFDRKIAIEAMLSLWRDPLNQIMKYMIIWDQIDKYSTKGVNIDVGETSGFPVYVGRNGDLLLTQTELLQIEENRIARRLVLKFAYKLGEEGFQLSDLQDLHFPEGSLRNAARSLESADLLSKEVIARVGDITADRYRITLTGQLKYEEGFAAFEGQAFIIAWCKDEIREQIIPVYEEVLAEFGYKAIFQEDEEPNKSIHIDIFDYIRNVPLIIADLTGERANCFIELGYAMALDKRIILTMKEGPKEEKKRMERMAFDTISMKYTFYTGPEDLEEKIRERVKVNHEKIRKAAEI